MPYGKGGRLGEGIDPRLMQVDYSGYADVGKTQGQALANMGAQIGGLIKQHGENQKSIKATETTLKAMEKNFAGTPVGDQASDLLQKFYDPDMSTRDKLAIRDSINQVLQIGISGMEQKRQQEMLELQKQAMRAKAGGGAAAAPNIKSFPVPGGGTQEFYWNQAAASWRPVGEIISGFGGPATQTPQPTAQPSEPEMSGGDWYGQDVPSQPAGQPIPDPASRIMMDLVNPSRTSQPQPELISQVADMGVSQGIGFTPPETPEKWSKPIIDPLSKRPVIINQQGDIKDYSKGDGQQININTKDDPRASWMFDTNTAVYEGSLLASEKLPQMKRMAQLLDKGLDTGSFASAKLEIKKLFGKDVADEEEFRRLAGEMAMGFVQQTKGAVSDREMDTFFNVLSPSIGMSQEANRRAVEFMMNAAKRADEQRKIIEKMRSENASPYEVRAALEKHRQDKEVDWVKEFDLNTTVIPTAPGSTMVVPTTRTQQAIEATRKTYGDFGR